MKELLTPPVIWFLVGVVFLLLELALPGLIIFFFGVGAWIVALCLVIFDMSLTLQLLVFVITSVVSLLLLRRFLQHKFFKQDNSNQLSLEEEFIGKIAIAEADFKAGNAGKVSFKGTNWSALADEDVLKGDKVKIISRDSITLIVKKL